ncbi:MAG TPA: hypothetical protein VKK81_02115 [Candidatus Binatia bacterium]|nr:hypothetical protein [Candidatus Binatia bacterium]
MLLIIKGEHHSRWRAVEQGDPLLDIVVQRRLYTQAAKSFYCQRLATAATQPLSGVRRAARPGACARACVLRRYTPSLGDSYRDNVLKSCPGEELPNSDGPFHRPPKHNDVADKNPRDERTNK